MIRMLARLLGIVLMFIIATAAALALGFVMGGFG